MKETPGMRKRVADKVLGLICCMSISDPVHTQTWVSQAVQLTEIVRPAFWSLLGKQEVNTSKLYIWGFRVRNAGR
jgi:hypothetical protein